MPMQESGQYVVSCPSVDIYNSRRLTTSVPTVLYILIYTHVTAVPVYVGYVGKFM